ncbi:WbqC family protein [bacterium]|nr:WbqC family protein [bacterium]
MSSGRIRFFFRRHSTINRAAIKTVHGAHWLTIPVLSTGHTGQSIRQTRIQNQEDWRTAHVKTLEINYHLTPWYDAVADKIAAVLQNPWTHLNPYLQHQVAALAPPKPLCAVCSSDLEPHADRTDRVIAWMRQVHADAYLVHAHEVALLDLSRLQQSGLGLYLFRFTAPVYQQAFAGYVPHLAMIDLVCNQGPAGYEFLQRAGHIQSL